MNAHGRNKQEMKLFEGMAVPACDLADDASRLRLALEWAATEYCHPECEKAETGADRRSFCFEHQRVADRAVVLLHGFTACPYEMRELGLSLFEQGCNVVGVRLAGHGTNRSDFARYNRGDWLASAKKGLAMAYLLGREVVLIGESMGGTLAALLAATFSELVWRLVLCAPCLLIANRAAYLAKYALTRLFLRQNDMGVQYEWQYDYWYQTIPTSGIAELVRLTEAGRAVGPQICAATLIIQAVNDRVVDPRGATQFFKTMADQEPMRKKLILFNQGHHNLTVDLNPRKNEVFRWVTEFIG